MHVIQVEKTKNKLSLVLWIYFFNCPEDQLFRLKKVCHFDSIVVKWLLGDEY